MTGPEAAVGGFFAVVQASLSITPARDLRSTRHNGEFR
jgi:hypothetical protein